MDKQIKNILGMVLIGFLVIFAFSLIFVVRSYTKSVDPVASRSFTASGEGKVLAVPDLATFSFGVITQGTEDLDSLQEENTEKLNQAIGFLKENGVADEDIQTVDYNVSPQYQYYNCNNNNCRPPEIVGYQITQRVKVKVRELEKAGQILNGIISAGANDVSGLNFTVEDPLAYENESKAEAIRNAKIEAESVARAGGFKLGDLISIEEAGGGVSPKFMNFDSAEVREEAIGLGGGSPNIERGTNEIITHVVLRYEIK